MFDLISSNPMIQTMDRSMTLASRRMGLIASNMANLDTPGYHTQDFSFQEALKEEVSAISGNTLPIQRTHANHMSVQSSGFLPRTTDPISPSYERNDGNDVSLDRESMLLNKTQAAYTLSSNFAQSELRRILKAITEGAK
ncbi:flagellar basal body rod protein FlgB [Holophaga foetida]|uniref:flagellar basal body rod protein FlgB n=1 Tax=Holophaga foetida TaxID=35839 RepID=UPI00024742E7|nr:flagellar basal body rod protein FlgB [Holophaga foetida]